MSKPTTAELITMLREFDCHTDVQKLAADRLEAAERQLRMFVWSESNPSEYVNELDKALATIKAAGELAEKWLTTARSKHMCDIDNTVDIRCAEQLQQLLSKQEPEQ